MNHPTTNAACRHLSAHKKRKKPPWFGGLHEVRAWLPSLFAGRQKESLPRLTAIPDFALPVNQTDMQGAENTGNRLAQVDSRVDFLSTTSKSLTQLGLRSTNGRKPPISVSTRSVPANARVVLAGGKYGLHGRGTDEQSLAGRWKNSSGKRDLPMAQIRCPGFCQHVP